MPMLEITCRGSFIIAGAMSMLVAIIVFLVVKDTQAGNMPLYRSFTDAKEKGSGISIIYSPEQRS